MHGYFLSQADGHVLSVYNNMMRKKKEQYGKDINNTKIA